MPSKSKSKKMSETQFYCVKCGKRVTLNKQDAETIRVRKTKNDRHALTAHCSKCDTKLYKFVKEKDADKLSKKYGKTNRK